MIVTRWKGYALGCFCIAQAIYLILTNAFQFLPRSYQEPASEIDIRTHRTGVLTDVKPIQAGIEMLGRCLDHYAELSGQVQAWSLFASSFGRQSIFPEIEVQTGDADGLVVHMNSTIEPENLETYLRWPSPASRLASYEFFLVSIAWNYSEESLRDHGADWQKGLRDFVRQNQNSLKAYLCWNNRMFHDRYPGRSEPGWLILKAKIYPSPAPGGVRAGTVLELPLARWSPCRRTAAGFLEVEPYDPLHHEFVTLSSKDKE